MSLSSKILYHALWAIRNFCVALATYLFFWSLYESSPSGGGYSKLCVQNLFMLLAAAVVLEFLRHILRRTATGLTD